MQTFFKIFRLVSEKKLVLSYFKFRCFFSCTYAHAYASVRMRIHVRTQAYARHAYACAYACAYARAYVREKKNEIKKTRNLFFSETKRKILKNFCTTLKNVFFNLLKTQWSLGTPGMLTLMLSLETPGTLGLLTSIGSLGSPGNKGTTWLTPHDCDPWGENLSQGPQEG